MDKRQFAIDCRKKGMGYDEIGKLLGLSRQRIHQIITGYRSPSSHNAWSNEKHGGLTREQYGIAKKKMLGEVLTNREIRKSTSISKITGMNGGSRDQVRELVRIRDGRMCQICKMEWQEGTRRLDVHHLDEEHEGRSFEKGHTMWDREHMDRMITLCHRCHFNLDSVRKKVSKNGILIPRPVIKPKKVSEIIPFKESILAFIEDKRAGKLDKISENTLSTP